MSKNTTKTTPKNQLATVPSALVIPSETVALSPRDFIERSPIDALIYLTKSAKQKQLESLALQVFAGAAAHQVRTLCGIGQGKRTDLADDPRMAGKTWQQFCDTVVGASHQTVAKWIAVSRVVESKLATMHGLTVGALSNLAELTDDAFNKLAKTVASVTEGKTQMEFLLECGLVKGGARKGVRPSNGDGGDSGEPPALPPGWSEQDFDEYQAADEPTRAAINSARALAFAFRCYMADSAAHPHMPSHYRDALQIDLATVAETLAAPAKI